MQSLHHLLTYAVHDIDHMLRYLLSIYLSSISISGRLCLIAQVELVRNEAKTLD